MNKKNSLILFFVLILATFSRLFIGIPNFSAIGSLALFCGALANKNRFSILLPFIALMAGDLILAASDSMYREYFTDGYFIYVYLAFGLTWLIGKGLKNKLKLSNIFYSSLLASLAFFIITNFGAWLQLPYSKTLEGLGLSYLKGLQFYNHDILSNFFLNQVLGDLFFTSLFFGVYLLINKKQPSHLEPIRIKSDS